MSRCSADYFVNCLISKQQLIKDCGYCSVKGHCVKRDKALALRQG